LCRAGEGLFIGSGALHTARPEEVPGSAYLCLDVHPRLLASFPGSVFERDYVAPYLTDEAMAQALLSPLVSWQRDILKALTEIAGLYEVKDTGYELEILSKLALMWLTLLKNTPQNGCAPSRKNETARAVLTYIEGHYGEALTLLDVARAVSFSQAECCRIFKKVTGQTIFSYLQSYRLTKGTELLQAGFPVSQIAYEVGFCSTSYFIEVFKRQFGMTPLQYRKKNEGRPPA
jgi:AraC-like DNA-binding protein